MYSYYRAESSSIDEYWPSSVSCEHRRRVGNDFHAPKDALARDRDSDRTVTRSVACNKTADRCEPVSSIHVIRSSGRSKLPSRVRGVEQLIRVQPGVRDRDDESVPLGRVCERLAYQ